MFYNSRPYNKVIFLFANQDILGNFPLLNKYVWEPSKCDWLILNTHCTYLHWFPPQDEEVLCSHHHETHEFMAQNLLNLICLQQQIIYKQWSDYRHGSDLYISHIRQSSVFVLGSKHKDSSTQKVAWLTCLTAMLTLTELMEPSIRTFSLSLRLMITGWRSNSLLLLKEGKTHNSFSVHIGIKNWSSFFMHCSVLTPRKVTLKFALTDSPYFHLWLVVSLHHLWGEILQAECSLQGSTHSIEIWTQGCRLREGSRK